MTLSRDLETITISSHQRWQSGYPWIYSNEIIHSHHLHPGSIVKLQTSTGKNLGQGIYNRHSLISVRELTRSQKTIDETFFVDLFQNAKKLRDSLVGGQYYRLVHAEADGFPGLIIDKFGDSCVCQINTAGMENLRPLWLPALEQVIGPKNIYLRGDHPIRGLEGLPLYTEFVKGKSPGYLKFQENSLWFEIDIIEGQKTGWFFDQRDNRRFVGSLCSGKKVLDVCCFTGGFSLNAAAKGATKVLGIDTSERAIQKAKSNAHLNGLLNLCEFQAIDAFKALSDLRGELFDVLILDPPAFVKSRKDLNAGLKGYGKLVSLSLPLLRNGGILVVMSCSHHVTALDLQGIIASELTQQGFKGRVVRTLSAGPDHPLHPHLPESSYLKGFVLIIDPS